MIEQPHVTESIARPAAVIALVIPRAEIQIAMGPAIQEVFEVLSAQGIAPAGPVFSHHHRMDPEIFDFEVGVPVAVPVTAAGRVRPAEIPAARVARTVYQGPYEGLAAAWGELEAWIAAQGLRAGPNLWELYVSGPESIPEPGGYRTELNQPLVGEPD